MTSSHPRAEAQAQSQVPNQHPNLDHLPSQIASEDKIRDVRISPDGSLILYQVTEFYRSGNRTLSALWIAETNKENSAVQLTSGEFNDRGGIFHPDGTRILFLSDREAPGKASHIYTLALGQPPLVDYRGYHRDGTPGDDAKPEPRILTSEFNRVQGFEISPDGNQVAFSSPDESTPEQVKKVQEKNDAKVVDSKDGFPRLRVYDFRSDKVRTLENIRRDRYIEAFTWDPASQNLLYRLRKGREVEYTEVEVLLESISVVDENAEPESQGSYPRSPSGPNIWLTQTHSATLQNFESQNILDARALSIHGLPMDQRSANCLFGDDEDAVRILRVYGTRHPAKNTSPAQPPETQGSFYTTATGTDGDLILCQIKHARMAAEVSRGTDTSVQIVTPNLTNSTTSTNTFSTPRNSGALIEYDKFTLFQTCDDAIWFNSWDARCVSDAPDSQTVTCTFAAVLSSGPRHEPPNVWSGQIQVPVDNNGRIQADNISPFSMSQGNLTKLSDHSKWLVEAPALHTEVIHWKTTDGTELSGLVRFPPGYTSSSCPSLPTLLFIHGGPYRRDIPDYMPYFCNWRELGAFAGYLTISPNYRGSQGRGHTFAASASAGIGVYDWPDCESMVDEVVKRGWADPERLGVAGWSHGGSLAAWGVTQSKTRYKAAVIGGGATDWEEMVMESGSPELEAAIGGISPWTHPETSITTFVSERKTSPVHNVIGVNTAVLILHGERDERIPIGQAYGFYRGLKRFATPRGREAAQLVVYPREPHGFVERRHAQDVMERAVVHLKTYI
ncbi:alpha/beta-hydrolase [Macrolepiota fuliginosa MF-IS2]|uniref:Dipeptidyl-peptidase V n=1 Tax=Macrolepiota fuliginosa MF-IS2 TaxID=1400762 RepID=A0A9P5X7H3_9AGAR|nr:alpha/beta-hydrolase [Macrolepiota fuliginosa MF-IS2]